MAFATGKRIQPIYYDKILNRDGSVLDEEEGSFRRCFFEETTAQIKNLLRAVVEHGTAMKAKEIPRMVLWKNRHDK